MNVGPTCADILDKSLPYSGAVSLRTGIIMSLAFGAWHTAGAQCLLNAGQERSKGGGTQGFYDLSCLKKIGGPCFYYIFQYLLIKTIGSQWGKNSNSLLADKPNS